MFSFEGFTASDFDAFEPAKWRSHAFNRERLEVKLKLADLGNELERRLAARFPGQEMGLTPERPSIFNQHQAQDLTLYYLRGEQDRRTLGSILDQASRMADNIQDPALHHRHIMLGLRIHHQGAEIGLWLHEIAWIDWKNLVQRCREYWERDKLEELLMSLPASVVYLRGHPQSCEAKPITQLGIDQILESFSQTGPWSFFGEILDRTSPVMISPELTTKVESVFNSLAELNSFIRWRPDNDHQDINELLKQHRDKAQKKYSTLQPGDKVRVIKGLASGRLGVVDAIERKGKVKVRLGTMLITLHVDELTTA